ncbi:hypothetical protein A4X06_0g6670 [Tilletia controversa]|uniref:Uncharacterized protein n=1 Tax=Tilletia controversa TaxID=13291 RepID=A0A8X7SUE8_9BASI|nr:hypothetical protein A4X06_0g6670 [Tilletia controversa]
MPNFTTVDQVSNFVDGSILWQHSRGANAFIIFAAVYFITILVILSVMIMQMIYHRSWWVFRIVLRGHSKIIIPNVHNSWILFIAPFVWILVGSLIAHIVGDARAEPVPNAGLWITTMWTPVAFAIWYQTWAITAARVNTGTTSFEKVIGRSVTRRIPSWLGNIVCLLLPAGPSLVGMIPGVTSNTFLERARHGWYHWHSSYDGMPDLTRDMLVDAQNIFHASIHGSYYLCISLLIWGIWCFVFGVAYTFAACLLIMELADHLKVKSRDPPPREPETAMRTLPVHHSKDDRTTRQPSQPSVVLSCFALLGVCLFMVIHTYPAAEANMVEPTEMVGYIVVSITIMLAGTASFISVTHNTFEASFAALVYTRRPDQGNLNEDEHRNNFLDMN